MYILQLADKLETTVVCLAADVGCVGAADAESAEARHRAPPQRYPAHSEGGR